MKTFDVDAAKRAGATESQIQQFMAQNNLKPVKTLGGFAGNIFKSGGKLVEDTAGAVGNIFNPDMKKNTVANLGRVGIGAGQLLLPGEQGLEESARNVGRFYKDRYGSMEAIGDTLYNDPVGAGADVATLLSGGGAALKGAGVAGKSAGLTRAGNMAINAGRAIDPLSAAGRVISNGIGSTARRIVPSLNKAADRAATAGIGNPAAQAKMARQGGRSVASFIDEYDLYDRSPESVSAAQKSILGQYDDLALNSGNQLPLGQVISQFDNEIQRLSQGVGGVVSDADQAKIAELMKRREQLIQASGGTAEMSPINTGVDTLTNFRRKVIDPDVPQSMFGLDARGSGSAQGVKKSRDIVKGAIDSSDPRLGKLGRDYGMAKGMGKIIDQSATRAGNRQMFNFTKLGSAGVGSVVAGAPGVVAGFAFEQAANNPRVLKGASKALRSAANIGKNPQIQQVGNKIGKTMSTGYQAARAASRISPDQETTRSTNTQTMPPRVKVQPLYNPPKKRSNFQNSISRRMGVSY